MSGTGTATHTRLQEAPKLVIDLQLEADTAAFTFLADSFEQERRLRVWLRSINWSFLDELLEDVLDELDREEAA